MVPTAKPKRAAAKATRKPRATTKRTVSKASSRPHSNSDRVEGASRAKSPARRQASRNTRSSPKRPFQINKNDFQPPDVSVASLRANVIQQSSVSGGERRPDRRIGLKGKTLGGVVIENNEEWNFQRARKWLIENRNIKIAKKTIEGEKWLVFNKSLPISNLSRQSQLLIVMQGIMSAPLSGNLDKDPISRMFMFDDRKNDREKGMRQENLLNNKIKINSKLNYEDDDELTKGLLSSDEDEDENNKNNLNNKNENNEIDNEEDFGTSIFDPERQFFDGALFGTQDDFVSSTNKINNKNENNNNNKIYNKNENNNNNKINRNNNSFVQIENSLICENEDENKFSLNSSSEDQPQTRKSSFRDLYDEDNYLQENEDSAYYDIDTNDNNNVNKNINRSKEDPNSNLYRLNSTTTTASSSSSSSLFNKNNNNDYNNNDNDNMNELKLKKPRSDNLHNVTSTTLPIVKKVAAENLSVRQLEAMNRLAELEKKQQIETHTEDLLTSKWKGEEFEWEDVLYVVNKEVFGNDTFRPLQREIINATLSGEDVFVMIPTAAGKSLTFQLAGLMTQGITIVIMPLLSLMQDQHEQLRVLGIGSRLLANCTAKEQAQIYRQCYESCESDEVFNPCEPNDNMIKFLFVTPEKISASSAVKTLFQHLHENNRLARFVVDEAHCVSQWGNDFRQDYCKLKSLRTEYPGVPLLALTASATIEILDDILKQLKMKRTQIFKRSFDRPNLKYIVKNKHRRTLDEDVIPLIKTKFKNDCGIIYCLTKKECEDVAAELNYAGIRCEAYHGGMDANIRERVQREWMGDEFRIIVATIAFGMGINKKDVRFVVHMSMPKCLENYYQESGRAGRDGAVSFCYLFYDHGDKQRHMFMVCKEHGNKKDFVASAENALNQMLSYCIEQTECRRTIVLRHFGETFSQSCDVQCDNCEKKSKIVQNNSSAHSDIRPCAEEVEAIVKFMTQILRYGGARISVAMLRDLLCGLKGSGKSQNDYLKTQATKNGIFGFMKTKKWKKDSVGILLRQMVLKQIFREKTVVLKNAMHSCFSYLELGPNAVDAAVVLPSISDPSIVPPLNSIRSKKSTTETNVDIDLPLSQDSPNVLSPDVLSPNVLSPYSISTSGTKKKLKEFPDGILTNDTSSKDPQTKKPFTKKVGNKLPFALREKLHMRLLETRRTLASERNFSNAGSVISMEGLDKLVEYLPTTICDLEALKISAFTAKKKIDQYGVVFTDVIAQFLTENGASELIHASFNLADDDSYVQLGGDENKIKENENKKNKNNIEEEYISDPLSDLDMSPQELKTSVIQESKEKENNNINYEYETKKRKLKSSDDAKPIFYYDDDSVENERNKKFKTNDNINNIFTENENFDKFDNELVSLPSANSVEQDSYYDLPPFDD